MTQYYPYIEGDIVEITKNYKGLSKGELVVIWSIESENGKLKYTVESERIGRVENVPRSIIK